MRYAVKIEFTKKVTDGTGWFTEATYEYDNIIKAVDTFNDYTTFMNMPTNATKKGVIIDTKYNEIIAIKERK